MEKVKRSKLIIAVLSFCVLMSGLGLYIFWNNNSANVKLKNELTKSGITTQAYVISLSKEDNRKLSYTDMKWQFMSDYLVEYWYNHTGTSTPKSISLKDYFDGGSKTKDAPKGLGRIEIQNSVSKTMFKNLETKQSFDVIYLKDQPKSVKILNAAGEVNIPPLYIFTYICLFLNISSLFLLWYYMKTGTTF